MALASAEWIVPPTTAHNNKILYEQMQQDRDKPGGILRGNRFYYKDEDGFYSFEKNDQENNRFDDFIFSSWDEHYDFTSFITADSGSWHKGIWTFKNCRIKQKNPDGSYQINTYAQKDLTLQAEPKDFFIPAYRIDELSLSGLYTLSKNNKGLRGTEAGLKLLERISFILLSIPLLMLGLPLLLIAHQKWGRDLSLAVPLSFGLAFTAWGCWSVMQSLAKAAIINPHLAAWSVHFLVGGLGTFLILQQDR
jgi:lipopolysaccharide export system permease protein